MAGTLKPSIAGKEAEYTHLGGATSVGSYNKNGSGLFNGTLGQANSQGVVSLYEGAYYNKIGGGGSSAEAYVLVEVKEKCNIYGHVALGTQLGTQTYNYANGATGKLSILQYDGTGYNIDVTDKYWVGRTFTYASATATSNGLTFQEFIQTELIDGYWQKIVSNLPPGQYRFTQKITKASRQDNEWFLEKVLNPSLMLKEKILQTMYNNYAFQHLVPYTIESEE